MNLNNGILDQFDFPGIDTAQILKKQNLEPRSLDSSGPGQAVQFLAHDKGVSYRFFIHADYSKELSKRLDYQKFNDVVMIEYFVSKDFKPTERVHLLPDELLFFPKEMKEVPTSDGKGTKEVIAAYGEPTGGIYLDAFRKWKEGVQTPGLPLAKWGVFSDSQVASLHAMGVYSVEQLAAMPRSKFNSPTMAAEFLEGFEQAVQYVNGKLNRSGEERLAKQLLEVERDNQAKDNRLRELEIQMRELLSMQRASNKKTPGRPRKVKVVDGVIKDEEENI